MFGFLNPKPHSIQYRRAYARLCQHQRISFGVRTLPFHSYESVFLYQLACDAGAFPASVMPHVKCCRLSKPTNIHRDPDAEIGRFCAGLGVLLASIKLEDDVRDAKGFLKRLSRKFAYGILNRKIRSARTMFTRLDQRFEANIRQLIADHHRLEQEPAPRSLSEYVQPTSQAFGYVFSLASRLQGLHDRESLFRKVGCEVGAALIAFDCAIDWNRDRKRGEYNPLAYEDDVENAMVFCLDRLHKAELMIRDSFSGRLGSVETLSRVQTRLLRFDPLGQDSKCKPTIARASRVALPVLSTGEPGTNPGENIEKPSETYNVEPVTDGVPPELPGGVVDSKKKQSNGCGNCGGSGTDNCCDIAYCGCISADCCSSGGGCEACCAIAECGACSC